MRKKYALNKQLPFIMPMWSVNRSFVRQFDCVTVIKCNSNQKVLQLKGKNMQRRIQNSAKYLRWNFLRK